MAKSRFGPDGFPVYAPAPATSWWVGKTREELAAVVKTEAPRMRWTRGSGWVNSVAFDGIVTTSVVREMRRAGSRL